MSRIAVTLVTIFALMHASQDMSLQAQAPPILSAGFDFMPFAMIENPRIGTFEETIQTRIANPRVQINLPFRISPQVALVNGFMLSALVFSYDQTVIPSGVNAPDELYDLSYRAALNIGFGEGWGLTLVAQPGVASDFENLSRSHWKLQGGAVVTRQVNRVTRIGAGALVQNQFGEVLPLPVFRLDWHNDRAGVEVRLPKTAAVFLIPNERWRIGLEGHVDGNKFRIGSDAAVVEDPIVKYSNITLGPSLSTRPTPSARITLAGGASLVRRFEISDGNQTDLRDIDLEPGLFARISIEILPRVPER